MTASKEEVVPTALASGSSPKTAALWVTVVRTVLQGLTSCGAIPYHLLPVAFPSLVAGLSPLGKWRKGAWPLPQCREGHCLVLGTILLRAVQVS